MPTYRSAAVLLALIPIAFAPAARAQDAQPPQGGAPPRGGGAPPGLDREAMWPAPTAEDWKRPCLITWQRSFEDALAVSRETKKPILVCVNMDGEIASEHYAGIRYRQPDIARLYEPYVTVIASVYRHTPRDHDEEGRRILCPRFGTVTCGEHIAIEPGLFEQFFDGRRIAPRHIGVELDSAEMYDVYYAWDTDTIFNSLREGIANRPPPPPPLARGDRPLLERVASPDIADRTAVEQAYVRGDKALRRSLLEAALRIREVDQLELLRLALFGFDVDLARIARRVLAQSKSESAIDLIREALRVPMEPGEREALITALDRLGETWPRARTLAAVHRGLEQASGSVDVTAWAEELGGEPAPDTPADRQALASALEARDAASRERSYDPAARLELAEAYLSLAADAAARNTAARDRVEREHAKLLLEDAHRAALRAEALGASGWRVDAAVAQAAYELGDVDQAYKRAERAVAAMPAGSGERSAMAALALFAQSRQRAIARAVRAKETWPAEWLTDVHAAYSVLARHPLGTDAQVAAHQDFLRALGASAAADEALDAGLRRFPESWLLHDRLRGRILAEKGAAGLEPAYEAMLRAEGASPNLEWFAGYASMVAAEFHRRAAGEGETLAAYERAIAHYERWIEANAESRATADHYVALALAGRARLALERGDHAAALDEILASFERRPEAAASLDGLGIHPVGTAQMLMARLKDAGDAERAARLQAALDALDPALLELPAFEREGPGDGARGRGGRRRDRGEGR
jgi:hypothetical protein